MKTATLTETKNNLSALIDQVRHGETILVLDRGRPVARIESAVTEAASADDRLSRLERQGVVRRGATVATHEILSQPLPKTRAGASALTALLTERESGR